MELENLAKINNLITNCNELINGKFLLINTKILAILDSINDSEEVYDLLANCMTNFNFESEFNKATLKNYQAKKITLPDEPEKILPFVFCMLVNIKNNEIDLDNFLKLYYSNLGDKGEQIKCFIQDFIVPFRDLIAKYFNIEVKEMKEETKLEEIENNQTEELNASIKQEELDDKNEEEAEHNKIKSNDFIADFFEKTQEFCLHISEMLELNLRLPELLVEEIEYIVETLADNVIKHDFNNSLAIITALKLVFTNIKPLRQYVWEINEILDCLDVE